MDEFVLLGNNAQYIRYPMEDFLDVQSKLGVRELDLTLQAPHIYIDSEEHQKLDELKTVISSKSMTVHCVTPLPYRYTICADAGSIQRNKSEDYYKQCILAAGELGAEYLCITASGACYDYSADRLLNNAEETLKVLAAFAGEHGVTLLLGTVLGEECPYNASTPVLVHLDEVYDMLTRVHSPYLKAYMDTEVISLCGERITQWFDILGDDIKLIRLTDGNYNGYRVWGKGCLPCKKYVDAIKSVGYRGKISLQIPGERYICDPQTADEENRTYLKMTGQV